jgi:hypothetical protein
MNTVSCSGAAWLLSLGIVIDVMSFLRGSLGFSQDDGIDYCIGNGIL